MIAVVDYRAGNLRSVANALVHLGAEFEITTDPKRAARAERLVFPGVGAAPEAMRNLEELGLSKMLEDYAASGRPFLGICLGAQIILERSDEGDTPCLGILPGTVRKLPGGEGRKVPQMGWNAIRVREQGHPVLEGVPGDSHFYFVHSYYPGVSRAEDTVATTEYGAAFPSVIGRGNVIAMQFHPERSGEVGIRVLNNFLRWDGRA